MIPPKSASIGVLPQLNDNDLKDNATKGNKG